MSESELNELRIRQMSALRRTAYRARSYAIVGAAACVITTLQLLWTLARSHQFNLWIIIYGLMTILTICGAIYCTKRVIALHREAKQSVLTDPLTPPDFSKLSDGSQFAKNLEEVE
ncbi:MAG TPA: hypothetical protein VKK61_11095 [Tepidisphaeraceae bacterium]|nr:hypothetical protein [Tepidisphaeraceae bacterium]